MQMGITVVKMSVYQSALWEKLELKLSREYSIFETRKYKTEVGNGIF